MGMGGEDDYGDEVLRRKMDGWSALARARDPMRRAREEEEKDPFADRDPFADNQSIYNNPPPRTSYINFRSRVVP